LPTVIRKPQLTGVKEGELQIRRLIKTKTPRIETHRYPARTESHFGRLFALICLSKGASKGGFGLLVGVPFSYLLAGREDDVRLVTDHGSSYWLPHVTAPTV
jgi:hypothetical protein